MEPATPFLCSTSLDKRGKCGSNAHRNGSQKCLAIRSGSLIQQHRYFNQRTVFLGLLLLQFHCVICLNTKSQYQQNQNYHQKNNILPDNIIDFSGKGQLKYVWGDALANPKAVGPDGNPYPWELASKIASKQRNPRTMFAEEFGGADIGLINPETTRQILLKSFEAQEFGGGMNSFFGSLSHNHLHHHAHHTAASNVEDGLASRQPRSMNREGHAYTIRGRGNKRVSTATSPSTDSQQEIPSTSASGSNPYQNYQYSKSVDASSTTNSPPTTESPSPPTGTGGGDTGAPSDGGCVPSRLCPSTYNTTAPLYGISLTSGQPVTIVQKFPDLLQQVVFQVCKTSQCDVIHGECVQTYLPYLFLVIPLGPVTLTGQDYVLVESGCVCRPKYASRQDEPPPLPFIQAYNTTKERRSQQG